ncbi:MAG: hypothetical protein ACI9P5_003939 [Saprospiraceae bacterium]|jgi:hypothetical protein
MPNTFFHRVSLFFLLVIVIPIYGSAQNIVNKTIPSEKIKQEAFEVISTADYYHINIDQLKKILNSSKTIEITIPLDNRSKTILLKKINILTPEYRLYTSSGKTLNTATKYSFYHGKVEGATDSKVSMIFYDDKLSISIFDRDGNYEINKLEDLYAGYYYHDRKLPADQEWECQVIDASENKPSIEDNQKRSSTPECVTTFLEIDHNMYNKHGGNIANVEAWAMTLFAQVAILYIEHNVPINISGIQIWDTADPYVSASNTSQALNLFRTAVHNNPNFNGRLAHLLSGRGLGGGIAYLNALCNNSTNVAVSANLGSGSTPYPNYSWNVMVVAHEMGHNMGSNHTQACVWNGNNTAIDGCGNIEGSCDDPGNPPNNVGGTIMSYCHLTSAGINFNNGFGPQPGELIYERFENASCVTGENCSYVSPFNDICNRAKELPILNYCIEGYFENYAVTPSGDGGNMSCGNSGVENDLWFAFEYLDVDSLTIEVQATDIITDLIVEVYSGDCNSLTSIDCGFSTNGSGVSLILDDPTLIGQTVFIRIVEEGSDEEGEFSICLYFEDLPCQSQLDTLINIYEDLSGTSWTNNQGWDDGFLNGTCDYCNWYGITCNYLGQIIEIDLSNNDLQGSLPQDLAALIELKQLNLSNNILIDTIPDYWDSLDHLLVLDMRFNQFTGAIPSSYSSMTRINKIHLDYNSLDSIPVGLGYNNSLRTFTASNNVLEGCFVNGISSFCSKDSIDLSNNIGLPYAGDVTLLCENGWGSDWDMDGFCREVEDCNDYDAAINPDADEVLCDAIDNNCDGTIDEGSDFGPNIWVGPDSLGVFDDPVNWSLGHIPKICENLEIGMTGDTIDLIIIGNGTGEGGSQGGGEGASTSLQIRNLSIGSFSTLHLLENNSLSILGNGVIENNGTFNVIGYINIRDQNNTTNTAFLNNGTVNVIGFGGLNVNEIGDYGLHNTSTGIIELNGYSYLESYDSEVAKSAIINEGVINVFGSLSIYGTYTEDKAKNKNGGVLDVKNGGIFNIY